jgi:hypothetical protein
MINTGESVCKQSVKRRVGLSIFTRSYSYSVVVFLTHIAQ